MSEIRVTNVVGENGSSPVNFTKGINMSGICTAPAFIPSQGQLSHRNLIINGDFRIAQRGSSSTTSGFGSVDRFRVDHSGTNEAPTQAQVDVAAGTTPYTLGFRKAYKITNGNQTGGAGAGDFIRTIYILEAQDIANSGWNYKSSTSYITLSFWVKASVAQTYYVNFRAYDGTQKMYCFSVALSANTWTKVTKTIPGHADLSFDNDVNEGMYIQWFQFRGTNNTGTVTLNQWNNYDASILTPDQTSTWYTTNDATYELTGVQLEVGSVATPFEHRSYGEELRRCQRYYVHFGPGYNTGARGGSGGSLALYNYHLPVPLRASPSFSPNPGSLTGFNNRAYKYNGLSDSTNTPSLATNGFTANCSFIYVQQNGHSIDDDRVSSIQQSGTIALSAEL